MDPQPWRRFRDLVQSSSPSNEELYEVVKCDNCDILKNKISDLKKILDKFTKGKNNLNILLSNQKVSYNKDGLGYEPINNI